MSSSKGGGGDSNTFYFSPSKKTTDEEEEDVDELPDTFIEFKAGALPIPEINIPPTDPNEDVTTTMDDFNEGRGQWGSKYDFLFSCISVSVGLGNVWRFPYLCYKNGGGAFLLVYFIAMIFCGVPIFFQEVAIGQYLGSGGMTLVAQLCPILKGVGIATMCLVFFLDIYYCVIIAWTFFYLIASFTALPDLPWNTCDGWWNSKFCYNPVGVSNETINTWNIDHHNKTIFLGENKTNSPVEEFWMFRALQQTQGLEHGLGSLQWELVGCLVLAWISVYLIIWKGLHSSGKIIWFTALFPYFVMFILLIRAVTLDGAVDGLLYYVRIDWPKLAKGSTWIDGATQIFFAYSVGMGALPALGSYNKFNHNCFRDAMITCVVNTCTCLLAGVLVFSILGYMAHVQGTTIDHVVNSGPGLVFLTYPDLVLNLPGSVIWAAIFFIMLLVLGVDSEFCNVEALITGIVDNWPDTLLRHRRKFIIVMCTIMFLLGLPMVTQGGVYVFQLMDFYSASGMSLLWVCFFQTIAISWIFGADKFCDCVEEMTGTRPNRFWYLCWRYFAPAVMALVFVFYIFSYTPVTYGSDYAYPKWAEYMGLCLSFSSMIWVPGYAIYYVLMQPGTIMQNLRDGMKPNIKRMRPKKLPGKSLHVSESGVGLLHNNSEYEMGRLNSDPSFLSASSTNL